jgi:hypothetical protein
MRTIACSGTCGWASRVRHSGRGGQLAPALVLGGVEDDALGVRDLHVDQHPRARRPDHEVVGVVLDRQERRDVEDLLGPGAQRAVRAAPRGRRAGSCGTRRRCWRPRRRRGPAEPSGSWQNHQETGLNTYPSTRGLVSTRTGPAGSSTPCPASHAASFSRTGRAAGPKWSTSWKLVTRRGCGRSPTRGPSRSSSSSRSSSRWWTGYRKALTVGRRRRCRTVPTKRAEALTPATVRRDARPRARPTRRRPRGSRTAGTARRRTCGCGR